MNLNRTLREIARVGPNQWDSVTDSDFSFSFDYILENHGSLTVIDPTSKAAREWLYRHLPDDTPPDGEPALR